MFVSVEPAEMFMYLVKLFFDQENPDSEDAEAKSYLQEHDLKPRYLFDDELEGRKYQVMQFGGCYLGNHLEALAQIQRRAVEIQVLTEKIQDHLGGLEVGGEGLSLDSLRATAAALAPQFQIESSFQTGDKGELVAVLDAEIVIEAAKQVIGRAH